MGIDWLELKSGTHTASQLYANEERDYSQSATPGPLCLAVKRLSYSVCLIMKNMLCVRFYTGVEDDRLHDCSC